MKKFYNGVIVSGSSPEAKEKGGSMDGGYDRMMNFLWLFLLPLSLSLFAGLGVLWVGGRVELDNEEERNNRWLSHSNF